MKSIFHDMNLNLSLPLCCLHENYSLFARNHMFPYDVSAVLQLNGFKVFFRNPFSRFICLVVVL